MFNILEDIKWKAIKREFIKFLEDAGVLKFGDFDSEERKKNPIFH